MKEDKRIKVFYLTVEEFRKRFPVTDTLSMPDLPKGHIGRVVSVKSAL